MVPTIGRPCSPLLHEVSIEEWLFHSRQKARGVLREGEHEILYILEANVLGMNVIRVNGALCRFLAAKLLTLVRFLLSCFDLVLRRPECEYCWAMIVSA